MIKFAAKHIKTLLPFVAGSHDPRYYIRSIRIEPCQEGGAILVATNGHTMMCIRDATAICNEPVIFKINRDAAKYCAGPRNLPEPSVHLNIETQRLTIVDGLGDELFVQPGKCLGEAEKFPSWQKVLPDFSALKQQCSAFAQVAYFELAAKAHPGAGRKSALAMRLWQANENGAIVVEYSDHPDHMLLIMPVRVDVHGQTPAIWAAPFGRKTSPQLERGA
ncbi:MAG: hypothetical protein K2P77_10330 [Burkholderiaceae bacterium]|nr:hypothetical protein [Burkholderiaceae bacterium]